MKKNVFSKIAQITMAKLVIFAYFLYLLPLYLINHEFTTIMLTITPAVALINSKACDFNIKVNGWITTLTDLFMYIILVFLSFYFFMERVPVLEDTLEVGILSSGRIILPMVSMVIMILIPNYVEMVFKKIRVD